MSEEPDDFEWLKLPDAERAELALDGVDALADRWAAMIGLVRMVKNVAGVSMLSKKAPDGVRKHFLGRQEALIDALIRMAWVEGFLHGDENGRHFAALKPQENP